jgi:hypothetical protein
MDDHARALVEHVWQECPVQPDGRKQVEGERALPLAIIEHREAARRRRRATNDMDDDVDAAEGIANASATTAQPLNTYRDPVQAGSYIFFRASIRRAVGSGLDTSYHPCVPGTDSA